MGTSGRPGPHLASGLWIQIPVQDRLHLSADPDHVSFQQTPSGFYPSQFASWINYLRK
jgi:hypothetical protein